MKKLLLITLFLFLACGGSSTSSGESTSDTTYVRLVVIDCPDCITVEQATTAFDRSKHFYETQLGRKVMLSGVDKVSDPFPERFLNIAEFYAGQGRFNEVHRHLKSIGIEADSKRGEFILIFDKHLLDNGVKYTAGMAHLCGLYQPNKFAVVYAINVKSIAMGHRMAVATAHEKGHWHGASHVDFYSQPNFMMSDIGGLDLLNIPPHERTLKEINQCITRKRYVVSKQCKAKNKPKKCMKNYNLRDNKIIGEVFGVAE